MNHITISGKVTGEAKALPFAHVFVSGADGSQSTTSQVAVTDSFGNYHLSVPAGTYVTASHIGYKSQTKIANSGSVSFGLEKLYNALPEVEVVAELPARAKSKYGSLIVLVLLIVFTYILIK